MREKWMKKQDGKKWENKGKIRGKIPDICVPKICYWLYWFFWKLGKLSQLTNCEVYSLFSSVTVPVVCCMFTDLPNSITVSSMVSIRCGKPSNLQQNAGRNYQINPKYLLTIHMYPFLVSLHDHQPTLAVGRICLCQQIFLVKCKG